MLWTYHRIDRAFPVPCQGPPYAGLSLSSPKPAIPAPSSRSMWSWESEPSPTSCLRAGGLPGSHGPD